MTLREFYGWVVGFPLGAWFIWLGARRLFRRSKLTRSATVRPPPMLDLTITNPQTRARRRTWVN